MPVDDVVLACFVKVAEAAAGAPDANDEVSERFGVSLSIAERVYVECIELELPAFGLYEPADEEGD